MLAVHLLNISVLFLAPRDTGSPLFEPPNKKKSDFKECCNGAFFLNSL